MQTPTRDGRDTMNSLNEQKILDPFAVRQIFQAMLRDEPLAKFSAGVPRQAIPVPRKRFR